MHFIYSSSEQQTKTKCRSNACVSPCWEFSFLWASVSPLMFQVLTKDLERHAAELQVQEGLPLQGEPIINVPLIHAR